MYEHAPTHNTLSYIQTHPYNTHTVHTHVYTLAHYPLMPIYTYMYSFSLVHTCTNIYSCIFMATYSFHHTHTQLDSQNSKVNVLEEKISSL